MIAALLAATVALVVITILAILAAACAGRSRPALRHLIWTSALVAGIAALGAALSGSRVTIPAPAWSRPVPAAGVEQATVPTGGVPRGTLSLWIGVVWAAGVAIGLVRLVRHYRAAHQLRRRATIVTDAVWTRELARAGVDLEYSGAVALRESVEIDLPLVTGLLRPTVIVPTSGVEWSAAERRSVLRHEVAHVANRDLWIQAIAMLACALHWFNPLAWWLAARCADDSELAADARVLAAGERPSSYAAALVAFAERTWRGAPCELAVGFVRRVSLARRVARVLAAGVGQSSGRPRNRLAVVTVAVAMAMTLALVRFDQTPASGARDWTEDAVSGLTQVLRDPSPQVRAAAAGALGRFARPESRAPLQQMLADPDAFVRDEARRALTRLPPKAH